MRLCLVSRRASWDICKNVWKMLNIPTCRTRDRAHISSASRIWLITITVSYTSKETLFKSSQQYFLPIDYWLCLNSFICSSLLDCGQCVCADHCALVYNHNCLGVCMSPATKYVHGEIYCWLPHDLTSRQLWYSPEPLLTIHTARHKWRIWPRCVSAAVWRPLNMYGGVSSNEDEMHASNLAICMFYKLFYRGRVRMNTASGALSSRGT